MSYIHPQRNNFSNKKADFRREENIFYTYIKNTIFQTKKFLPKNYFPPNEKFPILDFL